MASQHSQVHLYGCYSGTELHMQVEVDSHRISTFSSVIFKRNLSMFSQHLLHTYT